MPSRELESVETLQVSLLPPPQREEILMPGPEPENAETSISKTYIHRKDVEPVPDDARASTDVEDTSDESEDDGPPETTVRRGRAHSLDSAKMRIKNKKIIYLNSQTLSTEQGEAVDAATRLLTDEQKEHLERRQMNIETRGEETNEPGPSRSKGKGRDLGNWGNAGLAPEELNIDIQKAMLDAYERGRNAGRNDKAPKNKNNQFSSGNEENFHSRPVARHQSIASVTHGQNPETRRAGSGPAAQIVPNSSLGVALGNVARMNESPEDPSDSSGESSDHESSAYSCSTRSHSRSRSRSRRRRRHGSKRRSKNRTRRRERKSSAAIKPIPPKDYDGAADSRAYHRFVMEGEAYLRDGKVQRERQIRVLAHHLDGKAYNFYMQKVASDDPNNWTLHKFFTELFNYCFPVDY